MKHYDKVKKELIFLSDYREMDAGKWSVPKCKWCQRGMKKHSDDCFAVIHLAAEKTEGNYKALKAELINFMLDIFYPHNPSSSKSGSCIWCDTFIFPPNYVEHEKSCFAVLYLEQPEIE